MQVTGTIAWSGTTCQEGSYGRMHHWMLDGGGRVPISASPSVVPEPLSDSALIDPEEALLCALASCHMLFFLHLASSEGYVITRYEDHATAEMAPDAEGCLHMERATLAPRVVFQGSAPTRETLCELHERAHNQCFIARSLRTRVNITIPWSTSSGWSKVWDRKIAVAGEPEIDSEPVVIE